MNTKTHEVLDNEWTALMREAKDLGITIEEVKEYLKNSRKT
ncbi:anti-repressor SinI family protein [Alkalihalobacterium alkalinitrilicum]|nr:anti-repressor SinI family protein [Alkalihalobacterium alkalinitrilicum]